MEDFCQFQQRLVGCIIPQEVSQSLAFPLETVWYFPGSYTILQNTYWGLRFRARVLVKEKQPLEALSVLIAGLNNQYFWFNHTAKWWQLMQMAINIAQRFEPWTQKPICAPLKRLLSLSDSAPQPWQGRAVAYCYATLSLWFFQEGNIPKALDKVRIAIHADRSWGYPEYLLGWYGLLIEGIDPIKHFIRAIQIDGRWQQCLMQDPLLNHFPAVRDAVKKIKW